MKQLRRQNKRDYLPYVRQPGIGMIILEQDQRVVLADRSCRHCRGLLGCVRGGKYA